MEGTSGVLFDDDGRGIYDMGPLVGPGVLASFTDDVPFASVYGLVTRMDNVKYPESCGLRWMPERPP